MRESSGETIHFGDNSTTMRIPAQAREPEIIDLTHDVTASLNNDLDNDPDLSKEDRKAMKRLARKLRKQEIRRRRRLEREKRRRWRQIRKREKMERRKAEARRRKAKERIERENNKRENEKDNITRNVTVHYEEEKIPQPKPPVWAPVAPNYPPLSSSKPRNNNVDATGNNDAHITKSPFPSRNNPDKSDSTNEIPTRELTPEELGPGYRPGMSRYVPARRRTSPTGLSNFELSEIRRRKWMIDNRFNTDRDEPRTRRNMRGRRRRGREGRRRRRPGYGLIQPTIYTRVGDPPKLVAELRGRRVESVNGYTRRNIVSENNAAPSRRRRHYRSHRNGRAGYFSILNPPSTSERN